MTAKPPRRNPNGSFQVSVDTLQVGDRLPFKSWWPILRIQEMPKSRRVFVGIQSSGLVLFESVLRRSRLVARAPRKDERL